MLDLLFIDENKNPENTFGIVISWIGTALACFFFISTGILIYNVVKKTVDVKQVPYIIMVASILNCVFWLVKGILENLLAMTVANAIGLTLNLIYISIYWFYLFQRQVNAIIANVVTWTLTIGTFAIFYWAIKSGFVAGIVACVFNVVMYASPGQKIFEVIQTKDYRLIPIVNTIVGLLCSTSWLLYGVAGMLKVDIAVVIPNGLGKYNLIFL